MVLGWSESENAYNDVQQEGNQAYLSHEAIAGAASFGAFKVFEDRQRKEGKPVSHAFAKELLFGLAGVEVDKLAETKGEEFIDRERAKYAAKKNVGKLYDDHYINDKGADQYDPNQFDAPSQLSNY